MFRCIHHPVVCWFVGGCSTVPPGFVDIHLHLSYPVGCGFKFRAVWPAISHLAVFHEALFWLYIATVSFRHGLVNPLATTYVDLRFLNSVPNFRKT